LIYYRDFPHGRFNLDAIKSVALLLGASPTTLGALAGLAKEPAMRAGVVVVIVAHGQPDRLLRHLQATFAQTRRPDRVIIVDHARGYDIRAVATARFPAALVVTLAGDLGPAAALAYGFQHAVEVLGAAWVWLMGDEGQPAPDCLQLLLEAARRQGLDAAGPLVVARDEASDPLCQTAASGLARPPLAVAKCNGTLFHRDVFRHCGYPKAEVIIGSQQGRFLSRLRKAGITSAIVATARYLDEQPERARDRARSRLLRGLAWPFLSFSPRLLLAGVRCCLHGSRQGIQLSSVPASAMMLPTQPAAEEQQVSAQ
jgi:hypothetical protein